MSKTNGRFDADAALAGNPQSFAQMYPVLATLMAGRRRELAAFEEALDMGRRFRREVVDGAALEVERRAAEDPRYLAADVLAEGSRRGFLTMTVPRLFGGGDFPFGAQTIALEEVAAGCLGIANLLAVHGLAVCTVAATGDLAAMARLCRVLVDGRNRGRPALLSTAITEPGAGTDVEDVDLLPGARLSCQATPVRGGYRLSGRKVFISNGSIATTHVVIMPTDRRDPVRTTFAFLVDSGTPGFSIGRVERKMGQKACPAAELVFDDCFVPESARVSSAPLPGRGIELVLGATRGAVGSFGAGVARGAFERALRHARTHKLGGRWLIDHQWVQLRLADMQRNVMVARAAYVEAMLANELFGLSSLMGGAGTRKVSALLPDRLLQSTAVQRAITSPASVRRSHRALAELPEWKLDTASSYGSAAKVTGTDLGMANCHMALDIAGADGLRRDAGLEKLYRDAKLLQIYEGTNQLNRIELFKKGVRRSPARAGAAAEPAPAEDEPAPTPVVAEVRR